MIVDPARGLHESVANRGAREFAAALQEVFAERVGFSGARWNLFERTPAIADGLSIYEAPEIGVERTEFFLNAQDGLRIQRRGMNLEPVANNARVRKQPALLAFPVARHFLNLEIIESLAVILALLENRLPA